VRGVVQRVLPHGVPRGAAQGGQQCEGDWHTTAGGVVYAAGSGGTITGFGAGKMRPGFGGAIIIDDPHKADEATSEVMRKNVIDWFRTPSKAERTTPSTPPIILIMQRLHEADLAGFLLAGGNGEKWEHLCLDAIHMDERGVETALWPAKHSLETLHQMERASPYVFNGQYRQRPAPLAGGEFKPDAIGIIDAIPRVRGSCARGTWRARKPTATGQRARSSARCRMAAT
jgi:hypothetical protein